MINLYHYNTDRNKFSIKNKTASTIKKELYKEGNSCYLCNNNFAYTQLELEHKIPVEVGGHLFRRDNVALVCKRCHIKKTSLDKAAIFSIKKDKILGGKFQTYSFYPIEKVIKFFIERKKLISFIREQQEIYEWGANGEDYKQVFQEDNRE